MRYQSPAQALAESLVILVQRCRGGIELAEQDQILLGQAKDHVHEGIDALFLQVIADAAKRAVAVRFVGTDVVRRETGSNHVLAEAVILERAAGTFAVDGPALPSELRPVVLATRDLRQHPLRLDGKYLNLAVTMIGLAAREYLAAGKLA